MKITLTLFVIAVFHLSTARAQTMPATTQAASPVALPPDAQRQPGVPMGTTFNFNFDQSKIFPGTSRGISVYVPAQYTGDKPACVYIGLDGLGFGVSIVFDNLIAKKEMPVTIAIGISPGHVDSTTAPTDPRWDRSLEFDGMNDSLARFVVEELLPQVEKHKTRAGLPILLSNDPNDRCTGGGSTGGIGAFTLAWQRPDQFRRVFTAIGTFVGMRGGDQYPVLIRKTEPKPIRVFMEDGSNDEWGGGPEMGDWWMSNQTVERALEFSGYQVQHVWGTHGHDGRYGGVAFPDAMRFLWKDWPQPIVAGESENHFLKAILLPDSDWKLVADGFGSIDSLTSNQKGEVFFGDVQSEKKFEFVGDGEKPVEFPLGRSGAFVAGPDDQFYFADATAGGIGPNSKAGSALAKEIHVDRFTVTDEGNIYAIEKASEGSRLWLIKPSGEKTLLDQDLKDVRGLVLEPDHLWLAVFEHNSHRGYSYRVKTDGTVDSKQPIYWLYTPDAADDSGAGSACADVDGRIYVATRLGVQVLDRNGRSRAILPLPMGEAMNVVFGGAKFDTLYVSSGGKIYSRAMKSKGIASSAAPIKLPPWGPG